MQAIPTGFEAVYRREFSFVWAAARRLGVPRAALDDAVQDVFLTAYRRWDDLDVEVSPRAWLYGVTRRVAFRYRRSQARTARRKSVVSQASRVRHEPHAELDGAHDVDVVLSGLEAGRREVFVMSELLDMSGPEIAAELEIPLNTVYSRLRLARRQLERKVTREHTGRWIRAVRRHERPPPGQARRSWVLLLPALRREVVVGVTGTIGAALTGKLVGVAAAVAVVGAVVLTGIGRGEDPAPGSSAVAAEITAEGVIEPASVESPDLASGAVPVGSAGAGASVGTRPPDADAVAAPAFASSPGAGSSHEDLDARRVPPRVATTATSATPDGASPDGASPDGTSPEGTSPDGTSPDGTSPDAASASPSEDSLLAAEVAVLDRATAALRSGQAARSLQWLAEHERRFPAGRLVDVRKATRVRALCRLGRAAQARTEAAALRAEHPGSAVAKRVPDSCEDA